MAPATLGEFEQFVLFAVAHLGRDAYGAAVVEAIAARTGRDASISAVHTTLDRLEQKGFLRSRFGEPTPQRGGKRKRHYALTTSGVQALRASHRTWQRLADGLGRLLGEQP
jgi:DNA-binding PadR family transcriptional regulator